MYRHNFTSKRILGIFCMIIIFSKIVSCKKNVTDGGSVNISNSSIAVQWANMTLYTFRHGKNTPTYSSRSLGYLGLTMYESVVHADPSCRSLQGQLDGLNLPLPEKDIKYQWTLVLNSSMHTMLKLLYPSNNNISTTTEATIDSLYQVLLTQNSIGVNSATVDNSLDFGNSIASAIFQWAKTDGGYEAYLLPFDPDFIFPSGPSYWVPPTKAQTVSKYPLHPHWGENRTFSPANSLLPVPNIAAYSTDPQSDYYKMYKAIYDKSKNLTRTDSVIAQWWADDPTETVSPPGHSFNLATLTIQKSNPDLVKAAETYARVGMAVADAFICCWKTKYTYFNERPSTYIRSVIDTGWSQVWPEPPFPAFSSGHSTQAAAAATVLISLYGDPFAFTDNTHEGAIRYPFTEPMTTRSYSGFWACAEETGYSRLLGGIHTQQDNDIGLQEGKKIGDNINNLLWKK
jgi:hypothetical protein